MFGQLVLAIATLNVKYAGEPVCLALHCLLGLCAILSLGLYCTTTDNLSYHEVQTIQYMCMYRVVVTMYPTSYSHGVS